MIELDELSDVGLGTWGFDRGFAAEEASPDEIIQTAIDGGVNVIDTAPVYGFGQAEQVIGNALSESSRREEVFLSTKCGLNWNEDQSVWRDGEPDRLRAEIDESLERLQTDWIDAYFIHWPDEETDLQKSVETLEEFRNQEKIRYIGLSNVTEEQIDEAREAGTIDFLQPPFNLFESAAEDELFPYCREHDIRVMSYSTLCRGLLTGAFGPDEGDELQDVRGEDPKFTDRRKEYVLAVRKIEQYLRDEGFDDMAPAIIRWTADHEDVTTALIGASTTEQIEENLEAFDLELSNDQWQEIQRISEDAIFFHVEPEFLAPPSREEVAKLL